MPTYISLPPGTFVVAIQLLCLFHFTIMWFKLFCIYCGMQRRGGCWPKHGAVGGTLSSLHATACTESLYHLFVMILFSLTNTPEIIESENVITENS